MLNLLKLLLILLAVPSCVQWSQHRDQLEHLFDKRAADSRFSFAQAWLSCSLDAAQLTVVLRWAKEMDDACQEFWLAAGA